MASHVIYVTISDNIRHAAVPIPSSVDDSHFHHVVQEPHRTGRCLQHFHCGESVTHCQELHCGEHSLEMTQSVTSFFNIRSGDFKLLFLLSCWCLVSTNVSKKVQELSISIFPLFSAVYSRALHLAF